MTYGDLYDLYPNRALDCLRDLVRLPIDLFQLAAFDQEPDLWFGSGITQQHPPFPRKFFLRVAQSLRR